MRRNRPRRPFPYTDHARAVEEARIAAEAAFRAMKAAKAGRDDPQAAATMAWQAAVRHFHLCLERAYPPLFWDALDALKRGERSGIEEALEFLEADPWFFRSGYVKADILHALKKVMFDAGEEERLRGVLLAVVDRRDAREFRAYCRLARRLATPDFRRDLAGRAESPDPAVARRAGWMLAAIGREPPGGGGASPVEADDVPLSSR